VTGTCYASDYAGSTPSLLETAIGNMGTAYLNAAGRSLSTETTGGKSFKNVESGLINELTFTQGVYEWDTDVSFTDAITITGNSDAVFIFKTTGNIIVGSGAEVKLAGGVLAKNIFWQVAEEVEIGLGSHFEGIILAATSVTFKTGSTLNGRILAGTFVALQVATITQPAL
jgi:hypothetical protein